MKKIKVFLKIDGVARVVTDPPGGNSKPFLVPPIYLTLTIPLLNKSSYFKILLGEGYS